MKTSPGPWTYNEQVWRDPGFKDARDITIRAANAAIVAHFQGRVDNDRQAANARLIAAVPELLSELKTANEQLDATWRELGNNGDCPGAAYRRAAIAKAEGLEVSK